MVFEQPVPAIREATGPDNERAKGGGSDPKEGRELHDSELPGGDLFQAAGRETMGSEESPMKREKPLLGQKLLAAIFNNPKEIKTPWYRKIFRARSGAKPINRSKYSAPHQSDREKARRRLQRKSKKSTMK